MSKLKRKWLELNWNNTGAVRAQDIPFSDTLTIKDAIETIDSSLFVTEYEVLEISSVNETNKYVLLSYEPVEQDDVACFIFDGPSLVYNRDYYAVSATKRLAWDGKDMDGIISEGDVLGVYYTRKTTLSDINPRPSSTINITANYAASAFDKIMADTTAGAFTVTLPANPNPKDVIYVYDIGGAFATNNLTIARNGNKIQGVTEDLVCDTSNVRFEMFFVDATAGWRVYS